MPNWYWTKYSNECQCNAGRCRNFPKWQPTPHILYRLKNKELKLSNNSKNTWRLLLWAWISLICTASWCSENSELHNPLVRRGTALQIPLPWLIPDSKVRAKSRTQYTWQPAVFFLSRSLFSQFTWYNWEGAPIGKKRQLFLDNLPETRYYHLVYNHAHGPCWVHREVLYNNERWFLIVNWQTMGLHDTGEQDRSQFCRMTCSKNERTSTGGSRI